MSGGRDWQRVARSLSVRGPMVVALLMIAISIVVSLRALSRLEETQTKHLLQLSSTYLDGLSTSLLPAVVREDVWEVFDTLDRARERYQGLDVKWVTVTNDENRTIASSSPQEFPPFESLKDAVSQAFTGQGEMVLDETGAEARLMRPLVYQDREIGRIYALADISSLMQERSEVLRELVMTNALLTILLVAIGAFFMRRMLKPVGLLSEYLVQGQEAAVTPIPFDVVKRQSREFRTLFESYNAMAAAVNERETLAAELSEEEKLASVGRLASGMAHEINNPLGGMFNALDSLKRYGAREDVRSTSIRLLEQGLSGIRELVRSTLTTYKSGQRPRDLTVTDLDDLRLLVKPEARLRKLRLNWQLEFSGPVHVPAVPVRDAILNLLLNACHSSGENGAVGFRAGVEDGAFTAEVSDTGSGLPPHVREYIERKGAGAAPIDRRSGLGLWIVKRHCDELGAALQVVRSGQDGTTLKLLIPLKGEIENAA